MAHVQHSSFLSPSVGKEWREPFFLYFQPEPRCVAGYEPTIFWHCLTRQSPLFLKRYARWGTDKAFAPRNRRRGIAEVLTNRGVPAPVQNDVNACCICCRADLLTGG